MGPRTRSFITAAIWLVANATAAQTLPEAADYVSTLRSGTTEERTTAARWLGLHLVTDAYEPLYQALADAPQDATHAEFRRTARLMLTLLRRPRTLEFRDLDDVLLGLEDSAPIVRASAVRHLAYYAPPDGVDLAAGFLDDGDDLVRDEAITALRFLGDRDHAERVQELLDDPGAAVRLRALEYLLELERPELLPRLAEVTADPSPWIAQPAVRAFVDSGNAPAAAGIILDKLPSEPSAARLTRYLEALDRLGDRERWPTTWADDVRPLLAHTDGAVRHGAALLFGEGDPDVARDVLLGLLASSDDIERLTAARALAAGDWTLAADKVTPLLDDPVAPVRVAAIDLTADLPPARRRELLRGVLERTNEEPDVVSRALAGLAEVGTADDVAFLVERVRDTDSDQVRINAALTMAALERRWDTRVARDWFRQQLSDPAVERPTRQAVVHALQVVGDPSFLPLLADTLRTVPANDRSYALAVVQTMSVLVGRQVHGDDFAESGVQ